MAIGEKEYLWLQKENQKYLLLKGTTHFHLVRADALLTESRLNKLLRIYPCSNQQLSQMNLHFSAFKSENLRGVTLEGTKTGDDVMLWVGLTSQYALGQDYTEEELTAFFAGYTLVWNKTSQWKGMDHGIVRKLIFLVNGLSIVSSAGFWILRAPYKFWSVLCIFCQVAVLILAVAFPESFTIREKERRMYAKKKPRKGHLYLAMLFPTIELYIRTLTDFTFTEFAFWPVAGVLCLISLVVSGLLLWFDQEFRTDLKTGICLFLATLFLSFGTVGQLNYLLDFDQPDRSTVQVVDKYSTSGKNATYYCTVLYPDGDTLKMTVSGQQYSQLEIGSRITTASYDGGFGLPFTVLEPDEPDS